jgi:hypothetical protein
LGEDGTDLGQRRRDATMTTTRRDNGDDGGD